MKTSMLHYVCPKKIVKKFVYTNDSVWNKQFENRTSWVFCKLVKSENTYFYFKLRNRWVTLRHFTPVVLIGYCDSNIDCQEFSTVSFHLSSKWKKLVVSNRSQVFCIQYSFSQDCFLESETQSSDSVETHSAGIDVQVWIKWELQLHWALQQPGCFFMISCISVCEHKTTDQLFMPHFNNYNYYLPRRWL